MTRVLQPQRDIDREKGGEREREREYHDAANDMCYLILLW